MEKSSARRNGWWALCVGALASCLSRPALDEARLVELTHAFEARTATWPGAPPFVYERGTMRDPGGRWIAEGTLSGPEHAGTHIDAPLHYVEGRRATAEIPLKQLVATIRVIDVTAACAKERAYRVGAGDLRAHERVHGRVPSGAAVLIHTGWDRYWDTPERYFGGRDVARFPSLSAELARELVARGIDLVGIDSPGVDPGDAEDFEVHAILGAADVPAFENLTGLAQLPERGATLIALPLYVRHASGGPARVIAVLP